MGDLRRHRSRAPYSSRTRAFSLHELLVTLAAASTLAAVAIPAFQGMLARQRVATAANELLTALYAARSEAIKRGEHVALCPSTNNDDCASAGAGGTFWHPGYVLYADRNANRTRDPGEPVLRRFEPSTEISIRTSSSRDHVSYLPSGLSSGSNLSFALCSRDGKNGRAVIVANSGRARIASRLPDGRAPCAQG